MHLRWAEIGSWREGCKQGRDVDLDEQDLTSTYGQVRSLGVYCLMSRSRNVPPYPICHLQSKLSLLYLYLAHAIMYIYSIEYLGFRVGVLGVCSGRS